jgi:hypothetical protein
VTRTPISGDVLDAPTAAAEREHVSHPGFVDHLLVQFAHPPVRVGSREEDAEVPPIRDRSGVRDGEPLRAGSGADQISRAIPHDTRAQTREVLCRVPTGEHVDDCFEG